MSPSPYSHMHHNGISFLFLVWITGVNSGSYARKTSYLRTELSAQPQHLFNELMKYETTNEVQRKQNRFLL